MTVHHCYYQADSELRLLVSRLVAGSGTILDVGCGAGYFARRLRNCLVDGVEVHEKSALEATRYSRRIISGSIESQGVRARIVDNYDAILCIDVLEHLQDPWDTLAFLAGRLKPSGMIILAIPNVAHISNRLHLARGQFEYEDEGIRDRTHLRFFTYSTATSLPEYAALRVGASLATLAVPRLLRRLPTRLLLRYPNLFSTHSILVCKR